MKHTSKAILTFSIILLVIILVQPAKAQECTAEYQNKTCIVTQNDCGVLFTTYTSLLYSNMLGYTCRCECVEIPNINGDESQEICEELGFVWHPDPETSNNLCCGDDPTDNGKIIDGYVCDAENQEWTEYSNMCSNLEGQWNQLFPNPLLTALDGSDGCCGDDPADLGYRSPDGEYLCLKDYNESYANYSYISDLSGKWNWWGLGMEEAFIIHNYNNKADLISNLDKWYYCDATGESILGSQDRVANLETLPSYGTQAGCICPRSKNCEGEGDKNCCWFTLGDSCDSITSMEQCGTCYGDDPYTPIDPGTPTQPESGVDIEDTDLYINFRGYSYDPTKTCDENNGFKCDTSQSKACVGENAFAFQTTDTISSAGLLCCKDTEYNTVQASQDLCIGIDTTVSCEPPGIVCADNEYCAGSFYQTTEGYCCQDPSYCIPTHIEDNTGILSSSFLCYQENGEGYFGECCSSDICKNAKRQSTKLGFGRIDFNTFGFGTPIHSVWSFDTVNDLGVYKAKLQKATNFQGKLGISPKLNHPSINKGDWSGFDKLIFKTWYEKDIGDIILTFTDGTTWNADVKDYSTNGVQTARWHNIEIPFSKELKNILATQEVTDIDVISPTPQTILIDNYYLESDNPDLETLFCGYDSNAGANTWYTSSLHNRDACRMQLAFGWTGNKCCGVEQGDLLRQDGDGEYYTDSLAGCWNGNIVLSNERLYDSTGIDQDKSILYYDGKFYECDGTSTHRSITTIYVEKGSRPKNDPAIGWICDLDGTWVNTFRIEKVTRMLLVSKMYNISDGGDFTLYCDDNYESINKGTGISQDTTICVLNDDPTDMETKKVFVGIQAKNKNEIFNTIMNYAPFAEFAQNTSIPEDFCDNAEGGNFTKCTTTDSYLQQQITESGFECYYNAENKIIIFGMQEVSNLEKTSVLEDLWNSIKNFFNTVFGTTPEPLPTFPFSEQKASFKSVFIQRVGEKEVIGLRDYTEDNSRQVYSVEYKNFAELNMTDLINEMRGAGTKINYKFGCNKSVLNVTIPKQLADDYWRYLTSNIKAQEGGNGRISGECLPGPECETSADCPDGFACENGMCVYGVCGNGEQDGSETDIDCGGSKCEPCALEKSCLSDSDCESGNCVFDNLLEDDVKVTAQATGVPIKDPPDYGICKPKCGNNQCEPSETCEADLCCDGTKVVDFSAECGQPPPPPACEEEWQCTPWSECQDSRQYRTCICPCPDENDCTGSNSETQTCSPENIYCEQSSGFCSFSCPSGYMQVSGVGYKCDIGMCCVPLPPT